MDYKEAFTILVKLLENDTISSEEKEAIKTAMGVLSWATLSKNNIKNLKAKREKSTEW